MASTPKTAGGMTTSFRLSHVKRTKVWAWYRIFSAALDGLATDLDVGRRSMGVERSMLLLMFDDDPFRVGNLFAKMDSVKKSMFAVH